MLGSHYANRSCYAVLYEQLHLFVDSKIALKLPAVYATDRSDAVVLVLILILFCFVVYYGVLHSSRLALWYCVCVCVCVNPFCLVYRIRPN